MGQCARRAHIRCAGGDRLEWWPIDAAVALPAAAAAAAAVDAQAKGFRFIQTFMHTMKHGGSDGGRLTGPVW